MANLDKIIVITGASAGIGEALAREAVRRGARVVLAARREPELARLASELGDAAHPVVADVTKRADVEQLRDRAIARFGGFDVWVNNAGRGITKPVSQLTDDDIDQMIAVNFKSVLYGIQAALPHFKAQGRGQIVSISSGLARLPLAGVRSAYSASKAAVNLLMASLRVELAADHPHIHATTVMPGVVATEFGSSALHGGMDSRLFAGAQPVGEVAEVIADVIATPRAEVYTRPQMREMVAKYYSAEDVGPIEQQLALATMRR